MFITNQHNANENLAEPASMRGRLRDIIPHYRHAVYPGRRCRARFDIITHK